ncbi:MAG: DUF4276 family protein [Lysobacterales bacterium]
MKIACIVEGDGEVAALPILLRRMAEWRSPGEHVEVPTPIRVRRDRFLNRDDEFRRYLMLAACKCGEDGWILVLLDADDDCPATSGALILQRARNQVPHRSLAVVLAKREFEAWFIAAASSLSGRRGFNFDPHDSIEPESPRDAKGWIRARISGGHYGEMTDQPAFAALMDLQQAHARSRSFRKLCSEWDRRMGRE